MDLKMDPEKPYWVAFNHVNGIGAVRIQNLLNHFGSLSEAWNGTPNEFRHCRLPEKTVNAILDFRAKTDPEQLTERILKRNISICIRTDEEYPRLLKEIDHPPAVLYYVGRMPAPGEKLMAMVGTRLMTAYGQNVAYELARYLSQNGVGIVSGIARGIDGVAHKAVVEAGGRTYAVLGCGVDHIYPPEHRDLAREIIRDGGIISEYAPGTRPDRVNFPQRNRIISGMTSGTIVVEAGEKSGSLITARFAAEQGREVFVVPGNVTAVQSRGANRLIRDGARPFYDKEEILEFLQTWQAETPEKLSKPLQAAFSTPEDKVILELTANEPMHLDEIARKSGIPLSKISSSIILLELQGLVTEVAPQTYRKNQSLF